MELSTKCQSLAARSSGVTVFRDGGDLFDSVFQRYYQGSGIPRCVSGKEVAEGFLAYAKHLAGPPPPSSVSMPTAVALGLALPLFPLLSVVGAVASGPVALGAFLAMSRSEVASMTAEKQRQVAATIVDNYRLNELISGPVTLYTSETKLDGQPFYRLLNGELSSDSSNLRLLVPLIKNLNYFINDTRHAGGTVYSGVSLHVDCLPLLGRPGALVRLPRYLSTSDSRVVAQAHIADQPRLGAVGTLLVISIPPGFHGARDIRDVSEFCAEAETLFPPWSQFCVTRPLSDRTVHLEAVDKYMDQR